MLTEKPKEMKPGLWDKIMGTYLHNVQQSFLNNNNEMCWISVCFYTNTIRINMQAVTYFWNNTTNQVAFWWSIKRSKMKLSYLVKLLPTSTLPWIKYLWSPIHSKSYYFKKKRNSKHYGQSCWFQYMRYEWYSFTAANCMLKKYDVST